jgi:enoyl-CoA hydratase/carnithine racemase
MTEVANDRVTIDIQDGVADVRLVRTDKMNALDDAMFAALIAAGDRLKTEKGVRAVVLSGEGKAFCAGLDMGNFGKMASGERSGGTGLVDTPRTGSGANRAQNAALIWRDIPVPVIAAVHGVALGGGFQLTLGADMRFVAPDTKMAVLEIKWGLVPDMAGTAILRHLLRDDVLRELTFTGRILTGEEAVQLGLATKVSQDPRADALAMAHDMALKNPDAIRAGKRLLNALPLLSDAEALMAESREQDAIMGKPNQVEAVMSQMQKRTPNYS